MHPRFFTVVKSLKLMTLPSRRPRSFLVLFIFRMPFADLEVIGVYLIFSMLMRFASNQKSYYL
jgi:hypothetical protein